MPRLLARKTTKGGTPSLVWLLLLVSVADQVTSKTVQGSIVFDYYKQQACKYLTKFGASTGKYALEMRHNIVGRFWDDRKDFKERKEYFFLDLIGVGKEMHQVIQSKQSYKFDDLGFFSRLEINLNILDDSVTSQLFHHDHNQIQYFYLCDKEGKIKQYQQEVDELNKDKDGSLLEDLKEGKEPQSIFSNMMSRFSQQSRVNYVLKLMTRNEYDDHLHHGVEQRHTNSLLSIMVLFYLGLFAYGVRQSIVLYKRNEVIDKPLLMSVISSGAQMIGILFKFGHFRIYSTTGEDEHVLDVVSRLWYIGADVLLSILLLMMTKGWGIVTFSLYDDYEFEFVTGLLLMALRYVWILLGFFIEASHEDAYNIYDGYTGKFELVNTVVLFVWFLVSLTSSEVFKAYRHQRLKLQLLMYGGLFLLVKPVLILLVYLMNEENQHFTSNLIAFSAHLITLALLTDTFSSKKSAYMKVALSEASELGDLRKGN